MNVSIVLLSGLLTAALLSGCAGFEPMSVSYKCNDPAQVLTMRDGKPAAEPNRQCSQPKNILVFLDGTSNDLMDRTNVRRLYEIISNQDRPDIAIYYDEGVGSGLFKLSGNLLGLGFEENIRQAYRFLAAKYSPGDRIYIFGFSRGAATARALSGMVRYVGLLEREELAAKPENEEEDSYQGEGIAPESGLFGDPVYAAFELYVKSHLPAYPEELAEFRKQYKLRPEPVPVRVVGVWDTVESVGFPSTSRRQPAQHNKSYRIELHDNIDNAFHAVAVDENRTAFKPLLWDREDLIENNMTRKSPQVLEQVWFAGVHSDVGGGYGDSKDLAGVSLNWMLAQLEKTEGYNLLPLQFRVHANPLGKEHKSHKGIYEYVKPVVRNELTCGEKVHASVVQRMQFFKSGDKSYRPAQFTADRVTVNPDGSVAAEPCFQIVP